MATTINSIKVDFGLGATAPRVTFLQGANMDITNIRGTLRQIEESDEGRGAPGAVTSSGTGYGWIAKADGNYDAGGGQTAALAITVLPPFKMFFEAGATAFKSSGGSLYGDFIDSPGAIVQINNAVNGTLVNQQQLESATFIGKEGLGFTIDPVGGTDSTVFPYGNTEHPCKTEANLNALEADRPFRNIYVKNSHTITTDQSSSQNVWFGNNAQNVVITIGDVATYPSKDVTGAKFQDCTITGELDSINEIRECIVSSITNANGFIYTSTIIGPVVVSGTLSMEECWTATPGVDNVIDFNNTPNTVAITDWSGGTILVKNMVAGCVFGMGGTAGSVKFDSSCTGGTINHGGAIRIKEDLSTGTTINDASTATQVWSNSSALTVGKFIALGKALFKGKGEK